jgi:hypothetical protein
MKDYGFIEPILEHEKKIAKQQRKADLQEWLEWLNGLTDGLYNFDYTIAGLPNLIKSKAEELKKELQ